MDDKERKQLAWCFRIKDGLRIIEPNEFLSKTYLEQAKTSLLRAQENADKKDFLWATVVLYYAEYYSLYAFLQRIGVKCENHACSIAAVTFLLGAEMTKTISEHKEKRIDAQYYLKTGQEDNVKAMLNEGKIFVAFFDDFISKLTNENIGNYRKKLLDVMQPEKERNSEETETVKNGDRLEKS